ncbi:RAMP superfamily CRISPR-associated protein [Actinomyces bowdenii]|uniref:CRISPR-associated protein n=1 Tax=Actinomyces bowdenii TaxID=131109 RepID=A0A3P1UYV8_9ACTO|nr:RAMP superfamily CRISPR-associated protein [Actinomyces bowdenii]RRD26205.1 CRISPR-associated protein [Actinomyces bowdenii]
MSLTRYELNLALRTLSPLHSGSAEYQVDRSAERRERPRDEDGEKRHAEPRLFVRDASNRPILPGRSIKGALRAAWMRAYGQRRQTYGHNAVDAMCALWGGQERASALITHPIDLSDAARVERTGIAVDRYWGSAGDTALFVHEIVPEGQELTLHLSGQVGSIEGDGPREDFETLLGQIVALLKAGRVSLGGRGNAGWGRVVLEEAQSTSTIAVVRHHLDSPEGLRQLLSPKPTTINVPIATDLPDDARLRVSITWDSPTGILVAEPRDEKERGSDDDPGGKQPVPTRPLRTRSKKGRQTDETSPLVLPGSSVRGALRSRASRIARTILLAGEPAPGTPHDWSTTEVHKQLAQDPALVRYLFGSTERRGAVRVLETLARGQAELRERTHNAGDRWTGGVKDGALFKELIPDADWNDLVLEIDLDRISRIQPVCDKDDDRVRAAKERHNSQVPNRRRAALCLLGLALAELSTGALPLGSRGTRGLGAVRVTAMRVEGDDGLLHGTWRLGSPGRDGDAETGRRVAQELLARLRGLNDDMDEGATWTDYLQETQEAVQGEEQC